MSNVKIMQLFQSNQKLPGNDLDISEIRKHLSVGSVSMQQRIFQ